MSVAIRSDRFTRLLDAVRGARRIVVASHANPEGDALGSSIALGLALKELGKDVRVFNHDGVTKQLAFLPGGDRVVRELPVDPVDLVFIVDCGEIERVGTPEQIAWIRRHNVAFIDHHITSGNLGPLSYLDPSASATGELVYEVIKALGASITADIAGNLFCAISTDTGSFKYSNTTERTMAIASDLIACGADPWMIAQGLYERVPLSAIRLLGLALQTLTVIEGGKVAHMTVTTEIFHGAQATQEDTEGLVNYGRMINGVEVAVLFREAGEGRFKVSFRSRGRINVAAICQRFGGGGHRAASGCTLTGRVEEIRNTILDAVRKALQEDGT